jgi:polysaccharide pyruvyl transferase WcaK-like protein
LGEPGDLSVKPLIAKVFAMTNLIGRSKFAGGVQKCLRHGAAAVRGKPALAYVGGWLGKRNLGDEALLEAYRALFPDFQMLPFDGGRIASNLARRVSIFRAGILAGGTLIGQGHLWLEIAQAYLKVAQPLVIFGTGVETASFWGAESTLDKWIPILRQCKLVGVRGPISAQLLADAGIDNVEVVGDPVVVFARSDICRSPVSKSIGLNVGMSDGRVWGGEERVRDEMARLATLAKSAGWRVQWFVVWPKDEAPTRLAAERSGTADEIHFIYEDHHKFMRLVRPLTAFVGMKLHATMLATCVLTPSLMLEYRPKCRDYMKSIGQEAATLRTDQFTAEQAWEIARDWSGRHDEVALDLAEGLGILQKKQRNFARKTTAEILRPQ